ncbi:MAG: hypothetical protein N2C12_16155 [Planctomycetales bacterium]
MPQGEKQQFENDEVVHLIRNAELRDELEPYYDEAICRVNVQEFSTPKENEFLESMLAWERAPVLPISQWYDPPLLLPLPSEFATDNEGDACLHDVLWETIYKLFAKRIVLDFTDHLSDGELYCLIYRDILPSQEKKLDSTSSYLHWDCAGGQPDAWLCYYASEEEREDWARQYNDVPPERLPPRFRRMLPRRPL